jgi:hypothetical protein
MNANLTKEEIILRLRSELPRLRDEFGVEKMAIYGSFAKGNPTDTSDIDLLVQLKKPLGLDFVRLAFRLEDELGREVDLATFDSLKQSKDHPRRARMATDIERTLIDV